MAASLCFMPVWRSIVRFIYACGAISYACKRQVSTLCLCSGRIVNFYLRQCGGRIFLCGDRFAVICLACVAVSCEPCFFFSRLCGDRLLPVWQ